jgi:AAA+ superfamily predicted ATPase
MVDALAYNQHLCDTGTSATNLRLKSDLSNDAMALDQPPLGSFLFLLPPTIHGYDISERQWKRLLTSNTSPVIWNKRAFDHIILRADAKDEALYTVASSMLTRGNISGSYGDNSDNMKLHFCGGPGAGKTFTAEALAEWMERPLYRITSDEIGTDPRNAEKIFNGILTTRTAWRCVVLFENADIFVQRRSLADKFHNNALVSAFLHFLARYKGTLILTTSNSRTYFDDAFEFHFQLVLHFPSLDKVQRTKLLTNFIDSCEEIDEYGNTDSLTPSEIQDSQVKNAIRRSQQLAAFKKGLSLRFLQQSIKIKRDGAVHV